MNKRSARAISIIMVLFMVCVSTLGVHIEQVNAATESQNNIVARADYLYNITWECKKTVAGWRGNYTFTQGEVYRIPYGQPAAAGKYIGFDVSVENFLSATKDVSSVFYTKRSSYSGKKSVYYAMDCSAFVSWCWGASRHTTSTIKYIATNIGNVNKSNLSKIQLGDALNSTSAGHVVLVTDLIYDANGALTTIEITEQTPPQILRTNYSPDELVSVYGGSYKIYRYNGTTPAAPGGGPSSETNKQSETTTEAVTTTKQPETTTQEETTAKQPETTEVVTTTKQPETTTEVVTTTKQPETTQVVTTTKQLETTTEEETTTKQMETTKEAATTKQPVTTEEETTTWEETTVDVEEETTTDTNIYDDDIYQDNIYDDIYEDDVTDVFLGEKGFEKGLLFNRGIAKIYIVYRYGLTDISNGQVTDDEAERCGHPYDGDVGCYCNSCIEQVLTDNIGLTFICDKANSGYIVIE